MPGLIRVGIAPDYRQGSASLSSLLNLFQPHSCIHSQLVKGSVGEARVDPKLNSLRVGRGLLAIILSQSSSLELTDRNNHERTFLVLALLV